MQTKPNALSLYENELWCACELSQNLIRINIENKEIEEVVRLPFELRKDSEEYVLVHAYKNAVLLAQNIQNAIYIYTKGTANWERIDFKKIGNGGQLFTCSLVFGDSIYLFPGSSDNVVTYNILSGEIQLKTKLLSYLNESMKTELMVINPVSKLNDTEVVGITSISNAVFFYNVADDKIEIVRVGDESAKYSSCACACGSVLLYDKNNCLIRKIDNEGNICDEIKLPFGVYRLLSYSDEIVLIDSVYGNDLYIVDSSLKKYTKCQKTEMFKCTKSNVLGKVIQGDGYTYYYNRLNNSICIIDMSGIVDSYAMPSFDHQIEKGILENCKGRIIDESEEFSLSNYLSMLAI